MDKLGQNLLHALLCDGSIDPLDTLSTPKFVLRQGMATRIVNAVMVDHHLTYQQSSMPHLLALHDAVKLIKAVANLRGADERFTTHHIYCGLRANRKHRISGD